MSNESKILGGILIGSLLVVIGAVFILSKNTPPGQADPNTVYQIDYSKGEKIGSDSAKVKLVEFGDFQCPACASWENTLKEVTATGSGDIQFIYRHFPLPMHFNARAAANFAEYASTQGKFWEVHDKLFETQSEWENLSDPNEFFAQIGSDLGLNPDEVKSAIRDNKFHAQIQEDVSEGESHGVSSTPTFFLNGKKLNLNSFEDMKTAIQQASESSQ